jgi:uncharacterized protein (DUF2141 family)
VKTEPGKISYSRAAICTNIFKQYHAYKLTAPFVKRFFTHCLGLLIAALMSSPHSFAQPANLGKPEVRVESFRSTKGSLGCQIFLGEKGFPEDTQAAKLGMFVPITGTAAACIFDGLAQGVYAVTVL